MHARKKADGALSPMRRQVLVVAGRVMLVIAGASLLAAALISARLFTAGGEDHPATAQVPKSADSETPSAYPAAISTTVFSPTGALRVGIVAGHSGYDPGAVCPDGLTEAEVNMAVAQEVVALLSRKGYQVDLLKEYDDRLTGYRADALVSIHADSCDVPGASGFKVARVTDSAIPKAEDRLVDCLYQEYEATTGLPRHPSSITDNMTNYHAFREIDYYTPGAIIEMGFLLDDHDLLVYRPKLAARGIAAGVVCFLEGEK
jgi:N-acetylmuramoyl-L-alanine amidase